MIVVAEPSIVAEKLRKLRIGEVALPALEKAAETVQSAVRQALSREPGEGHDAPWLRSGALRSSVSVSISGEEAVVGSNDPAAVPQECGTRVDPPRPFLAPAAAAQASTVVAGIATAIIHAITNVLT